MFRYAAPPAPDGSWLEVLGLLHTPGVIVPPTGRKAMLWKSGWTPSDPSTWPDYVRHGAGAVTLSMCQSGGQGTGLLAPLPGVSRALVSYLASQGGEVFAGIGGSGDGGIVLTRLEHVTQALDSLKSIRDTVGITGIVLDLERAPGSTWNVDSVTTLALEAVDFGLKVGIWSALYGGRLEAWGQVAHALGENLYSWERGFYDFPEANDSRLLSIVRADLVRMRPYVAREDQLVCSFSGQASTSATPPAVMAAAYAAGRGLFPGVGFSVWDDKAEIRSQWAGFRALLGA